MSGIDGWNHNVHYHDRLVARVPQPCARALDVGCGLGGFTRRLSTVANRVDAIDIDSQVVQRARELSRASHNIRFNVADLMDWSDEPYDFIAMIAVLHHMPFDAAIAKVKALLRPAGVLGIIGLDRATSVAHEAVRSAIAFPVSGYYRLTRPRAAVGAAIQDPTMTLSEIRQAAARVLPGARIRRHLMWRYSLVWVKS